MYPKTNFTLLTLLLLFLAACGTFQVAMEPTVDGSVAGTPIIETKAVSPMADGVETAVNSSEPPLAYLTINGATQESGISSYCWGTGDGPAICADMIGIPTQPIALEATPLAFMQFELLVGQEPVNTAVSVRQVTESDVIETTPDGLQIWSINEPWNQYHLPASQNPQIELTLPPGLNVVSLFASWPEYGDVTYGFLVDVKADDLGSGSNFWTQAGDPRTGIRLATPCFWRVELPAEDPSGFGAFAAVNYSDELSQSMARGEGIFASGGLKIDFMYIRPSQLGLPSNAPLADIPGRLLGENITVEEIIPVEVNGQSGLMFSTLNTVTNAQGHNYLFALADDLTLLLGIAPGEAKDHPDIQGIIHSLALNDGVAVQMPEVMPSGPPAGDGPYACMQMGVSGSMGAEATPEAPVAQSVDNAEAVDDPSELALLIQDALLARDMTALEALMADPFAMGYWQSQGWSSSPSDIVVELSNYRLPTDTSNLTFTTDQAQFPDLNGMSVEAVFGPNNNTALIMYSEGWGNDGQGAAFLYLFYDAADMLHWSAILYAGQSFN